MFFNIQRKAAAAYGNHRFYDDERQSTVPITVCILILACYITCGVILFHELEKWGILESLYFCFTVLSTIGFGDLQPKDDIGMYATSAYILVGMALVAMCFSLIQSKLIIWLRKFATQETSGKNEISIVGKCNVVLATPIKSSQQQQPHSWQIQGGLLMNDYNSLPRTPRVNYSAAVTTTGSHFRRNSLARRWEALFLHSITFHVVHTFHTLCFFSLFCCFVATNLCCERRMREKKVDGRAGESHRVSSCSP